MAVCLETAKLKFAKISYSHVNDDPVKNEALSCKTLGALQCKLSSLVQCANFAPLCCYIEAAVYIDYRHLE